MSGWDTIFGEAALGLDLAKVDAVRDSLGPVLGSHGGRLSVLTLPRPPLERPAAVRIDPDDDLPPGSAGIPGPRPRHPWRGGAAGLPADQMGVPDNGGGPRRFHGRDAGHPHQRKRLGPSGRRRADRYGGRPAPGRGRPGPGALTRNHRYPPRRPSGTDQSACTRSWPTAPPSGGLGSSLRPSPPSW